MANSSNFKVFVMEWWDKNPNKELKEGNENATFIGNYEGYTGEETAEQAAAIHMDNLISNKKACSDQ